MFENPTQVTVNHHHATVYRTKGQGTVYTLTIQYSKVHTYHHPSDSK